MQAQLLKTSTDTDRVQKEHLLIPPSDILPPEKIASTIEESLNELYEEHGLLEEDEEIVVNLT